MIFSKSNAVKSFKLSVNPSWQDRPVAFGPGAILSGSIFLTVDRPLSAYGIRVVFECEEKDTDTKATTSIFSVEGLVWGIEKNDQAIMNELAEGSHMYLFAIKLPNANYPPSMHCPNLGYHVDYRLRGYLDLQDRTLETPVTPVLYLPLIPCSLAQSTEDHRRAEVFQRGDNVLEVTAQVVKPAYCPGELCTVKLTVNNKSEHKITSMQVALVATSTTLYIPPSSSSSLSSSTPVLNVKRTKTYTLCSENVYLSIAKQSTDNHVVSHFYIPANSPPSTYLSTSQPLEITYQIVISIPWESGSYHSTWPFGSSSVSSLSASNNALTPVIKLPVTIATVPANYPVPSHLPMPLPLYPVDSTELPYFIPNVESPAPSPTSPISPGGSFLSASPPPPPSPIDDASTLHEDYGRRSSNQDASGHLMVPGASSCREPRRKLSTSSTASSVITDCSAELNNAVSDSSSCTRVAV